MKKFSLFAVILTFLLVTIFSMALADGTETLGDPSIGIASGTGIVAAGVGLQDGQPGTININVPGNVQQALLYWGGAVTSNAASDGTIKVDGADVSGALIGGQTLFFTTEGKDFYYSNYRADITGLVSPGGNSFEISDLDNKDADGNGENSGAGILVIYDDGSAASSIGVKDGSDLAFAGFGGDLNSTVPQTFGFSASTEDRTADLVIFAGSVGKEGRTSTIVLSTDTDVPNALASVDGNLWDTLTLPVHIPAGATALTVQILSGNGGGLPASLNWVGAGLSVPLPPPPTPTPTPTPPPPTPTPTPPPPDGEGCTPGYWKQDQHFDSWVGYSPGDDYETVFGVDASFTLNLLDTMWQGGGGEMALGRHAVAALLNASSPDVDYEYSVDQVIAMVQQAYADDDFEGVKDLFEEANETFCPID